MRLLLFDIDGTLIRSNRAGRLAMGAALEQMFGTRGSLDAYQMSGKTDLRIVSDLLGEVGVSIKQIQKKMPSLFLLMAEIAREVYPQQGITTCPGVAAMLTELGKRDDVLLGLLTGNAEATAPLKLAAAGIDPGQFITGAYGSDDIERDNLPLIALRRIRELTGLAITSQMAVVVGDTPADIQCARAGSVKAVAVATGWHEADALLRYNPDHLFADLSDTGAVLRALLG